MADPDSPTAASVREFRHDYQLATKLPKELVSELAKLGAQAQEVWKDARAKSDFAMFAPWLEKILALTRRKAECYGWDTRSGGEPYDALLEEYEVRLEGKRAVVIGRSTIVGKPAALLLLRANATVTICH